MSPLYNLSYTTGLALSRLRIDAEGVIIEAEGYDRDLRKWTYHYDRKAGRVDWIYEPEFSR